MERLKIDDVLDAEERAPVVPQLVGMTLLDAAIASGVDLSSGALVALNHGTEIKRKDWENYRLQAGDRILVGVLPQGGKKGGLLQILLGVVLIAAAYFIPFLAPYAVNLYFAGAGFILTGVAALLVQPSPINTNSRSSAERDTSYYGLTGANNSSRPYGVVPKLYGTHKVAPNLASTPMIVNSRSTSTIGAVYDFGLGHVDVEDLRIGETPAYAFGPRLAYHVNTKDVVPQLIAGKVSYQQFSFVLQKEIPFVFRSAKKAIRVAIDLAFPQGLYTLDTQGHASAADVAFTLSVRNVTTGAPAMDLNGTIVRGMRAYNRSVITGQSQQTIEVEGFVNTVNVGANEFWERYTLGGTELAFIPYVPGQTYKLPMAMAGLNYGDVLSRGRATNTPGQNRLNVTGTFPIWSTVPGFIISDVSSRPCVARLDVPLLDPGEYEFTLTRLTDISLLPSLVNTTNVTLVTSGFSGDMFRLSAPHTMVEMEVDGSEKLSGVVQNLTATCSAYVNHYDAAGNVLGFGKSSNPAFIVLDILLAGFASEQLPPAQIDFPSFIEFANYCDEHRTWSVDGVIKTDVRHKIDVVVDYKTTVKELIESILGTCRAVLVITQTGRYGIAIDRRRSVPRQLITPENSWGFTGERIFSMPVHALRVGFIDAEREYQRQEITVYADGYTEATATNIESVGTFGVTDYWHAWAYGRYMLAQAIHRNEVFTVKMDIENLVVQRGDLVHVQHDVPLIGGVASRIVQINGNVVQISESLSSTVFAYTARKSDGSIVQGRITRVVDASKVELDSVVGLAPEDLIVVGLVTRTTQPYFVSAIAAEADLSATLTLIKYVPEIYDADVGVMPPWNPGFGDDLINASSLAIRDLSARREIVYPARMPAQHNILTFECESPFFSYAELYWLPAGQSPELIGTGTTKTADDLFSLIASVKKSQGSVTYRVVPYTATGLRGQSAEITVGVLDNDKPSAPQDFDLDLRRDVITLSWSNTNDLDVAYYEIRFSPNLDGATYDESTVIAPSIPWPATTFDVQARIGTYYAKSVDTAGQRSEDYSVAYTPAEDLFFLNVVGEVDDSHTGWTGGMSGFRINDAGDGICTTEVTPGVFARRSEYYYSKTFDNGRIFQTRLESNIAAHSYSTRDIMETWIPLEIAVPIAGSDQGATGLGSSMSEDVRVWHEVRWFDQSSLVMRDWSPLASADPLGFTAADFGQWRAFFAGDYTGKTFQFRLVAEYVGPDPVPTAGVNITTAKIKIDMHDRTEGDYDVTCPAAGIHVAYTPSFRERPTLMITPDIVSTGEQYTITQQTDSGFHIQFTDATGAAIQRKFDWLAKGYGFQGSREVPGRNYSPPAHRRAAFAEIL